MTFHLRSDFTRSRWTWLPLAIGPLFLAHCSDESSNATAGRPVQDASTQDSGPDTGTSDSGHDATTSDAAYDGNSPDGQPADAQHDAADGSDAPSGPRCGDGIQDDGEACDDGNNEDGDGCSADCSEKRVRSNLGVEATAFDAVSDKHGHVHLLTLQGKTLYYATIENGKVRHRQAIPHSNDVFTRFARPRLVVRPDGKSVHTSWTTPGGQQFVHVWRDESAKWHRETIWQSGSSGYHAAWPAIGVDLNGNVHAVAQLWNADGKSRIQYWYKHAGAWKDSVLQPDDGREWRGTSIYTDNDGGVHITWKRLGPPGHYRYASNGMSAATQPTLEIPKPTGVAHFAFGDTYRKPTGSVHHVFMTYTGELSSIWHAEKPAGAKKFSPSGLQKIHDVKVKPPNLAWPSVAASPPGELFVAWAENPAGGNDRVVYLARRRNGPWKVEVIDKDAGLVEDSKPALVSTQRSVLVIWRAKSGKLVQLEITTLR